MTRIVIFKFFILGGKAAHRFEFPHQALLGYVRDYSYSWVCGGSLVSPKFILTGKNFLFTFYHFIIKQNFIIAAHCKFNEVEESGKIKGRLHKFTSISPFFIIILYSHSL